MKIESIDSRDYITKLSGTIVSQRYNRAKSGIRIGYIVEAPRKSKKHCVVKWWDYKRGTWCSRNAHPRLSDINIPIPKVGYFVDTNDNLRYVSLEDSQKNRWAYGLSYHKLKMSGMDDYNILSTYDIYKPRVNDRYINVSKCKYENGTLYHLCLYKTEEVTHENYI